MRKGTLAHCPSIGRAIALSVCLAWASVSGNAVAQNASNNAAAQALFDAARTLMKKGNYAEACPKLEESQRLDPGSGTLLNLGICYEQQGLTASAWTTFIDAAAAARASGKPDRVKAAQKRADALAPKLIRLTIRVASDKLPELEVKRDGTIVRPAQWGTAITVDPGAHVVSATAAGRKAWQKSVELREGQAETVVVPELELAAPSKSATAQAAPSHKNSAPLTDTPPAMEAPDSNPGGGQRTFAILAGTVGVAGLAVGTVFGLRSKSFHDDALPYCNEPTRCSQEGVNLVNQARGAGNVSTAAFVVGAVGLTAGAILWFTAPRGVEVGMGPGTLQMRGSF
jgi:serine/threonine-protein kinase